MLKVARFVSSFRGKEARSWYASEKNSTPSKRCCSLVGIWWLHVKSDLIELSDGQDPWHPYFQLLFLRNLMSAICSIPLCEGKSKNEKCVCTQVPEGRCVTAACGVRIRQFGVTSVCDFSGVGPPPLS